MGKWPLPSMKYRLALGLAIFNSYDKKEKKSSLPHIINIGLLKALSGMVKSNLVRSKSSHIKSLILGSAFLKADTRL